MNPRTPRSGPSRSGAALIHRGPQAASAPHSNTPTYGSPLHAPNAALLIDFDNVTMGIRSDLSSELRTLLGSDIIKGKVAVQRAYADWRRYPQYVVPLAESSIDMIWAPAYGSSKKNATDIRLAVDAIELVFTRPEIGTYILLSGDSDFASLVLKLKEYGKYVIGVGIRESSSDLLVMNCDEYYSYNALAGLVKNTDEEPAKKWDPWELVTEAVTRMKRNGDVMRSDRLKQVMVEIDASFDEKDLGMAKFSRFVQDAVQRGLLSATKLENGQLEIGLPGASRPAEAASAEAPRADAARAEAPAAGGDGKREGGRSRRGRRGRGRDREDRPRAGAVEQPIDVDFVVEPGETVVPAPTTEPARATAERADVGEQIGAAGERLTRDEAFDLVRRAVAALTHGDEAVRAGAVRAKARDLLGRDSESLSDRNFPRILKDAHDSDVIDLRRRGDDFEIARAAEAEPVTAQLARSAAAAAPPPVSAPAAPRGMGPRGVSGPRGRMGGGRLGAPPADLLSIGVVGPASSTPAASHAAVPASAIVAAASAPTLVSHAEVTTDSPSGASRGRGRKPSAKKSATVSAAEPPAAKAAVRKTAKKAPAAKKPRAKKVPARAEA
ncbi:MAG TPA: NYN domain-containing protein [Gemmatimonadaceae bacterium]